MNPEKFYDQYWQSGVHIGSHWSDKEFRKWLGPLIGRGRVLDYGCGMGTSYQRQLAAVVKKYAGADVSEKALGDLRQKGFEAFKINPDGGTIESPANAFDGAVCSEVFEHLFDPLAAAREIHRVLKPGGVLVGTVPNFGYHMCRLLALLRAQVPSEPEYPKENRFNGVHIRYFSRLMFRRLFRSAGFENISVGSFGHASVWDVFVAAGHFGYISQFARDHFPAPFHLTFLEDVWPNVFAARLRAVGYKPK